MERAEVASLLGLKMSAAAPRDAIVCESKADRFRTAFAEGVAAGGNVFLADPKWSGTEREAFLRVCRQSVDTGSDDRAASDAGWLCIPTGGTSGIVKLARHDGWTVAAAVNGFARHFGCSRVNVVGTLPLHHVSGLMAWLRSVITRGAFVAADWTELQRGERPTLERESTFISLVPTQLQRLLAQPDAVAWLRRFEAVFIGGGPTWPSLLDSAAEERLPLALSYGMTETAAMIACVRPAEFAAGDRSSGTALPHARVEIADDGTIAVSGDSVFRGYFPTLFPQMRRFETSDSGRRDEQGRFWVLGRKDLAIVTGVEKVDPLEVERVLRSTEEFSDVAVIGIPDATWGQAVIACYPNWGHQPDREKVHRAVERELSAYKRPKRYVPLAEWPRNAQGKLNRETLRALVEG